MNWEALGAIGEIVGAAAVVLTLVYVARQVREASEESRQNQIELRRSRYDALNRELSETADSWGDDADISDIMLRGFSDPSSLSQVEIFRFYASMQRLFRALEALFVYSAEGGIHEWGARGWRVSLSEFITFPGVRTYWEDRRHWFSEAFREEVSTLLTGGDTESWRLTRARGVMAEAYVERSGEDEQ